MSLSSTPIFYFGPNGDHLPFHASGFLYRFDKKVYLISALHCFSGKNPLNGHAISPTGFIPDRIQFYVTIKTGDGFAREEMFATLSAGYLTDPSFDTLKVDISAM